MIKISIITIAYNELAGLKKTVVSLQNQSYLDYEHIVIDGGSTDGSEAYLKEHKDSFAYWISEPDKGVYHAMNKGIAYATGEYLLFLNAGDHMYSSTVLETAQQELTGEAIIYFNLHVVENKDSFIKPYPSVLSFSYFVEDTLPHPATFIKKSAFAKAGTYKEDFKIVSDWKFFIDAICKHQLSYKHVDTVLSTFYIGGMSSQPENRTIKHNERQQVLQNDYAPYMQDIHDVIAYRDIIKNFRRSRIITLLVKLGLLNKF